MYILFFLCLIQKIHAQFEVNLPNELVPDEINTKNLNGICYQFIKIENSPKKLYKSTAFFIDKNYILTSAHNLHQIKGSKLKLFPAKSGSKNSFESIVLNVSNDNYYRS